MVPMTQFDLLSAVQPSDGWFVIVGIKDKGVDQRFASTREEADTIVARFLRQEQDVYFAVAKFATDENRLKTNVQTLKAFWLDIDCGPDKAVVNEKTGRAKGYVDQVTGMDALKAFCKAASLPRPIVVNSGRGLHVYWALTEDVTRAQWEPVAARLRDTCLAHGLVVDPAVFEAARILRIPNTSNFKGDTPLPVEVLNPGAPVSFGEFSALLGVEPPEEPKKFAEPLQPKNPKREQSELGKLFVDSSYKSFAKIMRRSARGDGCAQLMSCLEERATLEEPRWFNALSVAKFCKDSSEAIHTLSEGHPDYDPGKTEHKIAHILGPHTCAMFEINNPGGCRKCPHKGKIKSPITLGFEVQAAEPEDDIIIDKPEGSTLEVKYKIPVYPEPYFRGVNGGIYRRSLDEEGAPTFVFPHDLYVVKRMKDTVLGDVVILRLHMPEDGVRTLIIPNREAVEGTELRKELAAIGVMIDKKRFDMIMDCIFKAISELQFKIKVELMRVQFGWADNDSKFIIGDREIGMDGTYHSPPSGTTSSIAAQMTPTGTLEKWKEVFALYGKPGLEPHAFAALTAFGAPILRFLGQNGAIINVIHPKSGTGKTTILRMCNSVYGHPYNLCAQKDDTLNARTLRLGIMNNLPFTIDEMTNTKGEEFSALAYSMSQGRGKDRLKQQTNEMRANLTTWSTMSLCSSNASFAEKLAAVKNSADGEMMRMIEYNIDYTDTLEPAFAKEMFDHQLMENYGHAGDIYATWLVNNLEEAKTTALAIQAKMDRELKLMPRERLWSAVIAANMTGGLIAKHHLGLIDWDLKRINSWVADMFHTMRDQVQMPVGDVMSVIGDYINRHMQNVLVVNDAVDARSSVAPLPIMEPKGELLIRYEPDTQRMILVSNAFKQDCVKSQINYQSTVQELKKRGILVKVDTMRLSKGMKISSPPVHCLLLDGKHSEFLKMDNIIQTDEPDAGGAG